MPPIENASPRDELGPSSDGPHKRALLIGINEYEFLEKERWLSGCVNDVDLIGAILKEQFGFRDSDMTTLRNGDATRDRIMSALEQLIEQTRKDDIVVIHYSGHGSQVWDAEGDEAEEWDETIMPYDSGRNEHPNRDITDDMIYDALLSLTPKTSNVTLIFDSCHSGTITRDPLALNSRSVDRDERRDRTPYRFTHAEAGERHEKGPANWLPLRQRYLLIAGCRDEESSYELNQGKGDAKVIHGAMTYHLARALRQAEPGTTYRDIVEQLKSDVATATRTRQHPQVEGTLDRELFGVRDIEPMRFVRVSKRFGNEVTLGAGAAMGMTPGSRWGIYPASAKRASESERLGQVEITRVRAVDAQALVREESTLKAIAEDTRAFEEAHSYSAMQTSVLVRAPRDYSQDAARFIAELEESTLLRHEGSEAGAAICAYVIPARRVVSRGDPVPQLGAVREAIWAVTSTDDGQLVMPACLVGDGNAAKAIREHLEKLTRYQLTKDLTNRHSDSALAGKIEVILKRGRDGVWEEARPGEDGGEVVFEEGDRVALEIRNGHTQDVFVNGFDFGLTYRIEPLTWNERVPAGKSLKLGEREGDDLVLYVPDDFPFNRDPNDTRIGARGGTETFKIFVTTREADFSSLAQAAATGGESASRGAQSPLEALLNLTMRGRRMRDVQPTRVPPDADWTTLSRSFTVHRRGG